MIPLFEDREHILSAHDIVRTYLSDKKDISYQRVFLARSDPAVNYGSIPAVLMNKITLLRLSRLSQEIDVPIYPILGAGSAPFRGNLRPQSTDRLLSGYPSVHTFTIQSSFKFDNPPNEVSGAIAKICSRATQATEPFDEERAIELIERYTHAYCSQLETLAPAINTVAVHVPKRRKRKLHIELFGYSRNMGIISLPRAITFTAALYSLGTPPEILGVNALTKDDVAFLKDIYGNVWTDLSDVLAFWNPDSPCTPPEVRETI